MSRQPLAMALAPLLGLFILNVETVSWPHLLPCASVGQGLRQWLSAGSPRSISLAWGWLGYLAIGCCCVSGISAPMAASRRWWRTWPPTKPRF